MKGKTFEQDLLHALSPTDRDLFSEFGLGDVVEYPFHCVHHGFEHHAKEHGDSLAVEDFQHRITYAELDREANCLANLLRAKGVVPGSRVGLLVERSIHMVVGIVAVLKAGGAYVPLDGNVVSNSTLAHALRDSGASLVLFQRKFSDRVNSIPAISLEDSVCQSPSIAHCYKPEDLSSPNDSAYIIYTSGTTGVPKGVDVMHRNVTNLVCTSPGNIGMRHGLRVSQLMNISFDMAAWEILGSLCNGSTLCLRGKTSKEWRAVMKTVDIVVATPSMLAPHPPADYPNIKSVAVAGEPCPKALADNWSKVANFYNCCGPTEITIVNTMQLHSPGRDLAIGGPTPNNTVYVLDEEMRPVKIGEMGVMWAGGAGITRGYLNLPEKTAEKYKPDPFLNDGSLMFNTGDLGRWYPDGSLEHLGRIDHQVKVKGFRVELDGVASAMEKCPGVKVAAAVLIEGELWGFFTPSTVDIDDVKATAQKIQPYYAVPTRFIKLDTFPETTNGKTDKRALQQLAIESTTPPGFGPTTKPSDAVPARRALNQGLLDVLSPTDKDLFSKFGVGETVEYPFHCVHHAFESQAREHGSSIAVEDFEQKITYAELDYVANCLANRLRAMDIMPGSRVGLLVERSIFMVVGIVSVLKAGAAYIPLDGNVVSNSTLAHALRDSGASLVLLQRKFSERVSSIPTINLEDFTWDSPSTSHCHRPEDRSSSSDSAYIIYTSGTTGVPKGVDVMHRNVTNLVCTSPGNIGMRHGLRVSQLMNISFDMAAWEILGSLCNGSTLCLRGKTSKEWRAVMKTVDIVVATPSMLAPHPPTDYPNIKAIAVAGEPCPKALADNWSKVANFYNCCGPTEITIVNTMQLHSPGRDLAIGGPTPNNTVYVLNERMEPVKIGEMGIMWAGGAGITRGYLNLPEKTAEKYKPDPFLNDDSLMFNTGDLGRWYPDGSLEHLGRIDHQVKVKGFRVELDGVASAMEKCPGVKVAAAVLIDGELWGFFTPSTVEIEDVKATTLKIQPYYAVPTRFIKLDAFPETTNGKTDKRALQKLAVDSLAAPHIPAHVPAPTGRTAAVGRVFRQDLLSALSPTDRVLFSKFGLGETVEHPYACVHHAFEFQAREHGSSNAVEDFEQKITYTELDRVANCLANRLRTMGVVPGSRVGLLVERSIFMVVGIVSVLKAGAAYVPLDGNVVSNSTLAHALRDSGASLVLLQRKFSGRVSSIPIISLEDSICDSPSAAHCHKPEDQSSPSDSAYIIYTSGTTGVPKGVDVMHRNVTNLVCTSPGNIGMRHGLRVSQLMNISFDMAAWEILGSLCNGSTLCLRGKTSKEWRAVMKTVDIVVATPSMLAPHPPADYPNIKAVAVAGEPCPKALADNWSKVARFYNCCGPTEITIVNTMQLHSPGRDLAIGGPTPNNTVYVLDEHMKPVNIGEMGIMWAGGAGITRGYLNLPEKTAEKYKPDPFLNDGSLMFNTGDLGRWYPDGSLEHLGRIDHQVKVKGFRVELDGVASAMEKCPGVKVAAAVLIDGELWGFFAPSTIDIEDVKATALKTQPYYAVPTRYIKLDAFPETTNGKIDKRALQQLAADSTTPSGPESIGKPLTTVHADKVFEQNLLDVLSPTDRVLFSKFGLGETVKYPFHCVHHAFEFHAKQHGYSVAVEDFQHKITYAELDRETNCLANRLRTMGVVSGARVGLLVERSIFMVIGILSILKAGGAYVPLDGNVVSDSTLAHALRDSGASLALLQRKFSHRVNTIPILSLEDSVCHSPSELHCHKPEDLSSPNDSAYIIYTSGTTGVPKGVDVMHRNVTNLVCTAPGNLGMRHGLRVSQLMNISFDMAAWEILGSLCNGSTLCLRGKTSKEWRAVMKTVDIVVATPSMLAPHPPADYPNIKSVAVAGEPCPKALADNWSKVANFYNGCGPTEITIVNTMQLHSPGRDLAIGGPTPNNTVYVLDEEMRPVKIGEMGVMWAGGAGITRGYLNLPEKTAEKYKPDPFLNDGSLMFNTGDLGRWYPDGSLEHLGRIDHQVKVKGFRVELDGVASAMEKCPGVKIAAAVLIDGELWGFFTPSTIDIEDVKATALKIQPYYAVPTKFVKLDTFPETTNGKTDKRALQQLALDSVAAPQPPIADVQPVVINQATAPLNDDAAPMLKEKGWESPSVPSTPSYYSLDSSFATDTATHVGTDINLPLDKEGEPSSLEDQAHIWAGYEQETLPPKNQGKFMRNLCHQLTSFYGLLFTAVLLANLGVFIYLAVEGTTSPNLEKYVIGNLFASTILRQDYIVDMFFVLLTSVPHSWPLWIRRICARVYHINGLRSGAAVSTLLWLILFAAQATIEMIRREHTSVATLSLTYILLASLLVKLSLAYPKLPSFGVIRWLLEWTTAGLTWAQIISLINDWRAPEEPLRTALIHSPLFWLVVVMTASQLLSLIHLRRVSVRSENLSSDAVQLHFDNAIPNGSSVRLSNKPFGHWHTFPAIPESGNSGFSVVINRAGGWANNQIAHPPTKIWKRTAPTFGVMRIAPMFRRVVLVATGSGIGPCLPTVLEQAKSIRLLWAAPSVRETFGNKLVDSVLDASPDAVIYDIRAYGQPDMVKLTYRLVKEFDAEAVIVVSNPTLTRKVVYGMVSRGIPAFGVIGDS